MIDRPLCKVCGLSPASSNGFKKSGERRWSYRCSGCSKKKYKQHKKNHCEVCGFVAKHTCQLDVDHVDGNKTNNSLDNLITLCANCHRLKTQLNKDNHNIKYRNS